MVQAGVGAFPTAPGFPGAGGAQTAGAGAGAAGTVGAPTSDGSGLSMAVKNAAAVAAAAAAAQQAAQDSQLQHQLKQQQEASGAQVKWNSGGGDNATLGKWILIGLYVGFFVLLQPQFSPSLLGAQPTAAIVAVSQHQQPASALPLAMSIVGNHTVTQSTVATNGNGIEGQTNGNGSSIVSREGILLL